MHPLLSHAAWGLALVPALAGCLDGEDGCSLHASVGPMESRVEACGVAFRAAAGRLEVVAVEALQGRQATWADFSLSAQAEGSAFRVLTPDHSRAADVGLAPVWLDALYEGTPRVGQSLVVCSSQGGALTAWMGAAGARSGWPNDGEREEGARASVTLVARPCHQLAP